MAGHPKTGEVRADRIGVFPLWSCSGHTRDASYRQNGQVLPYTFIFHDVKKISAILILIFNRFGLPAASHGGYATRLFPHERWRV